MTSRPSGGEDWTRRIFTDKQKNKRKMTSICFAVFEATFKTTTRYSPPFPLTSKDCEFMSRVLIKSDSTPFYQLVDQYQMAL